MFWAWILFDDTNFDFLIRISLAFGFAFLRFALLWLAAIALVLFKDRRNILSKIKIFIL